MDISIQDSVVHCTNQGALETSKPLRYSKKDLKKKNSVIFVEGPHKVSFWHAIVISRCYADGLLKSNPTLWKAITRPKTAARETEAEELAFQVNHVFGKIVTNATYESIAAYLSQLGYMLVIFNHDVDLKIIFKSPNYSDKVISLFEFKDADDNVSYHPITSIRGFCGVDMYCLHCQKKNSKYLIHKCEFTCKACNRWMPCEPKIARFCDKCKRTLVSDDCFDRHQRVCVHTARRNRTFGMTKWL